MPADVNIKETDARLRRLKGAASGSGIWMTAAACLVVSAFAALLFRCAFYGVHTPDESFYLTVPYRLYYGDVLLADEFQGSQFCAFLQYLPFAAFMKFAGSTDGIILFFRLLFVFCQTAVSFFVFFRMKRFGVPVALGAAVLYMIYVPEFVESLDYYTMSLMPAALIAVLLCTSEKISVPEGVFIGVLAACAVVAMPMLALVYFAYTAAVPVGMLRKKKKPAPHLLSLRVWVVITAGVLLTAAVFFAFLLSRAPLGEYVSRFGNLFSGYDHDLPFTAAQSGGFLKYGVIFKTLYGLHPAAFPLSLALTAALLIDVRRLSHRAVWCIVLGVFYAYYVVSTFVLLFDRIDQGMFSPYILFVFTLHCYLLTERKNKKLPVLWCAGLAYVLCLGAISQANKYAGVAGCAVSDIACVPAAADLTRELRETAAGAGKRGLHRIAAITLAAVCVLSVSGVIAVNAVGLSVSDRVNALLQWDKETVRETVADGPLKGITVSQNEKAVYDRISADLRQIAEAAPGRLYVEGQLPMAYLMNGSLVGACSAYYVDRPQMLEQYYAEDPDRVPRAVYFPTQDCYTNLKTDPVFVKLFLKEYGASHPYFASYTKIKGEAGYILLAPDAD